MSAVRDGGPAFPLPGAVRDPERIDIDGMSLRDYFAAAALPQCMFRWLALVDWSSPAADGMGRQMARLAYDAADAMPARARQPAGAGVMTTMTAREKAWQMEQAARTEAERSALHLVAMVSSGSGLRTTEAVRKAWEDWCLATRLYASASAEAAELRVHAQALRDEVSVPSDPQPLPKPGAGS